MEVIENNENELKQALEVSKEVLKDEKPKKRGRPAKTAKIVEPPPAIDMKETELAISQIVQFSGVLLAKVSKFDGFNFAEEELDIIGKQGAEVAKHILPKINPVYMATGALCLTLVSCYGLKYYSYIEFMEEKKKNKAKELDIKEN